MNTAIVVSLGLLLAGAAPAAAAEARVEDGPPCEAAVTRDAREMGTRVKVHVCPVTTDAAGLRAAQEAVLAAHAEVSRLNGLWSSWVPDSDVRRINAAAGGAPVRVAPETMALLQAAREGSAASDGLFDVTFAPLGALWTFDTPPGSHTPTTLRRVPTAAEVAPLKVLVGWRGLELDPAGGTVRLARPGMRIHLGGIGKGAAVDRVVALLRARGLRDFAVQAGGDLYCAGINGTRPWRVGVKHPRRKGAILGVVAVRDAAFSTSGDYERFAIIDGKRLHHILDTRTGFPATASQSVTVLAPTATDAEILTKVGFILGGSEGLAAIERAGGRGVVVTAAGEQLVSADLGMEAVP